MNPSKIDDIDSSFKFLLLEPCCREHLRTGKGVDCAKCPADHFKENYSDVSNVCKPCPSGSQADNGSTLVSGCQCVIGKLYNNGSHWMLGRHPGMHVAEHAASVLATPQTTALSSNETDPMS